VIPLTRFLQLQTSKRWIRHGLTLVMILTAASALGSHSRGALLAILGMAAYFWLKSRQKFAVALVLVLVGIAFVAFLPADWWARMNTIGEYEQDASAMGRINAWWMTFNLAKDRLTGGGFDIYDPQIFAQYAPDPSLFLAAHSIYFQILGEHGFPGLALFLLLWILVWRSAGKLARHRDGLKETSWCRDLGAMTQASLMGYAIGGAFLSLAYFDLPYDLMVMVILTQRWVQSRGWEQEPAHSPAMPAAVRRLRPSSKVVT